MHRGNDPGETGGSVGHDPLFTSSQDDDAVVTAAPITPATALA